MKVLHFALVCSILFIGSEGVKNWLNDPLYPCVICLCHARTGCWRRQNCANYSISYDYWQTAGSLGVDDNDPPSQSTFNKCMADENCIVGTIIQYTEKFGKMDCNCDGTFDCKDRFAIHLNGKGCANPTFGDIFATRFNECASSIGVGTMLPEEGNTLCAGPVVV